MQIFLVNFILIIVDDYIILSDCILSFTYVIGKGLPNIEREVWSDYFMGANLGLDIFRIIITIIYITCLKGINIYGFDVPSFSTLPPSKFLGASTKCLFRSTPAFSLSPSLMVHYKTDVWIFLNMCSRTFLLLPLQTLAGDTQFMHVLTFSLRMHSLLFTHIPI